MASYDEYRLRGMLSIVPSDSQFRIFNKVHQAVFTASRGRLLGKFYGMPALALTTTGRKSGKPRTSMLTAPVRDGERIVLVASKGGAPTHPMWFLNLRDNPDVEVLMNGKRRRMRAHVATPEERDALWPRVVAGYKGYAQYQTRTDRDIPVVVLEPA